MNIPKVNSSVEYQGHDWTVMEVTKSDQEGKTRLTLSRKNEQGKVIQKHVTVAQL